MVTSNDGPWDGDCRGNFSTTSQDITHLSHQFPFLELNLFCWLPNFCHLWSRGVIAVQYAQNFSFILHLNFILGFSLKVSNN